MTLLREVIEILEGEEIAHAVIGAAALAVHGVSRATGDLDPLVGRHAWQREALGRASRVPLEGTSVAVVTPSDLVLLKLYAGGPQDAWDVDQLLDLDSSIANEVEDGLPALPEECAVLWRRIRDQRR